jgi:hypothetical protein
LLAVHLRSRFEALKKYDININLHDPYRVARIPSKKPCSGQEKRPISVLGFRLVLRFSRFSPIQIHPMPFLRPSEPITVIEPCGCDHRVIAATRSDMKALVLSGGSILGAFQAGAIAKVLGDGFVPELVIGTSVGALNPR